MPYPYTIEPIIQIGQLSTSLAQADVLKAAIMGEKLDPRLPILIAMETDSVKWKNEINPSSESLINTANYLYSLCGIYASRAWYILSQGNGGSNVSPVTPISYQWVSYPVTISGNGGSTYTDTYLIDGRDLHFLIYNNQVLTTNKGDFTFDPTTGTVTFTNLTQFDGDDIIFPFNWKVGQPSNPPVYPPEDNGVFNEVFNFVFA